MTNFGFRISNFEFEDGLRSQRPAEGFRPQARFIGAFSAAHPHFNRESRGNSKFEIRNSKSSEAGYTLVIFVMVIAVMAVLATVIIVISFRLPDKQSKPVHLMVWPSAAVMIGFVIAFDILGILPAMMLLCFGLPIL